MVLLYGQYLTRTCRLATDHVTHDEAMARDAVLFLRALGFTRVDLLVPDRRKRADGDATPGTLRTPDATAAPKEQEPAGAPRPPDRAGDPATPEPRGARGELRRRRGLALAVHLTAATFVRSASGGAPVALVALTPARPGHGGAAPGGILAALLTLPNVAGPWMARWLEEARDPRSRLAAAFLVVGPMLAATGGTPGRLPVVVVGVPPVAAGHARVGVGRVGVVRVSPHTVVPGPQPLGPGAPPADVCVVLRPVRPPRRQQDAHPRLPQGVAGSLGMSGTGNGGSAPIPPVARPYRAADCGRPRPSRTPPQAGHPPPRPHTRPGPAPTHLRPLKSRIPPVR
ncbi:hypothetical protein ACH4JS_12785 [Streptomyces sp. NPDC017638]|uniref:hypothetical protein n=1 Tax=Streptomyces sp. NPDC017638 TaxID=3365004 RepID=UPI00378869D3